MREHAEASLSIGTEQEGDRQGALYVAWWLGGEPWMPCQGVRVNVNRAPWEVRDGVDTRKQVLTQQVLTRPSRC